MKSKKPIEAELEQRPASRGHPSRSGAPRASTSRAATTRTSARESLPKGMTLEGMKLVVDCANGAGYKVVPRTLADLGAEIIPIGCSPNGRNINDGCGSTSPSLLQLTVPGVRAAAGIALDGDGDRLVMVDQARTRRRRRPAHLHHRDGAQARRNTAGSGSRHGHEQSRARSGAARAGHRIQARAGRRPLRAGHAARDRRLGGRRDLGTHPAAGQDHHGRCA